MPIFMILRSDTLLNFFHLSRVRIRSRFFQCITKLTFCQGPPKKNFLRVGGGAWEATPPASQTWEAARLASQKWEATRPASQKFPSIGGVPRRGGVVPKRNASMIYLKKFPAGAKTQLKAIVFSASSVVNSRNKLSPPDP